MEKYMNFLLALPLFNGLSREELAQLLECCNARVCEIEDAYKFWWHTHPDDVTYLTLVLKGQLKIYHEDWRGNRLQLGVMQSGQSFNDYAFFRNMRNIPFLGETSPGTVFLLLENERLLEPCQKNCLLHWRFMRNFSLGLLDMQVGMMQKIECLSQRSTRDKIVAYLTFHAAVEGSNKFTVKADRQEMADELSVDRTGLCSELSKMQREGMIACHRNQFELLS